MQKAILAVCDHLRTVAGVVKAVLEGNDSSMPHYDRVLNAGHGRRMTTPTRV
jgi:hypothetical protein